MTSLSIFRRVLSVTPVSIYLSSGLYCPLNRFFTIFLRKMRFKLRIHLQTLRTNRTNTARKQIFCKFDALFAFAVFSQFTDACAICHLSFFHFKLSADWYVSRLIFHCAKFRKKILSLGQNFRILPIWFEVPEWHSADCKVPPLHCEKLHH